MLRTLPGRHPHLDTRPGPAAGLSLLAALLIVCACERSPEPAAPTTSNGQAAQDQETLKLVRRRNIGLAYLEAERYADAAAAFDELIQLIPEEPMVHANRGLIGLREGKLDEAKTHLETAGRLAPDDPSIALLRSVAAVYEGHDDLARTLLEHAVQKNPDQVRARWALVEVLKRSRSDAAAETLLTHLDTLLEYAPANVVVRLALARHLLEQGELEQASGHLAVLDDLGIASSPRPGNCSNNPGTASPRATPPPRARW